MIKWLFIAAIVFFVIELWGIVQVASWLGPLTTTAILLLSCLIGIYAAKQQGRRVLQDAQRQMQAGQPPGRTLLDGICVLFGGLLLIIPGFLSDLVGLTLLLPFTRPYYRHIALTWLERKMRNDSVTIYKP
ncbi:FxsA family protein [Paenibacillaceae bacterium]|nr:FxsA family protein [Paenibacillaceae bacterium]